LKHFCKRPQLFCKFQAASERNEPLIHVLRLTSLCSSSSVQKGCFFGCGGVCLFCIAHTYMFGTSGISESERVTGNGFWTFPVWGKSGLADQQFDSLVNNLPLQWGLYCITTRGDEFCLSARCGGEGERRVVFIFHQPV
jgi:hypothetical protein